MTSRRKDRFGCDGCNNSWPWLCEPDGRVFVRGTQRYHLNGRDGDPVVPCENPAIRQLDDSNFLRSLR